MITYRQERVATAREEVEEILPQQWAFENDPDLSVSPNWGVYEQLQDAGVLLPFIARDDGEFVGYLVVILHKHLHAKSTTVASIPTYFVKERPYRALILRNLFVMALSELRERKIDRVTVQTSVEPKDVGGDHSAGRLLEGLGFAPHAMSYKMKMRADLLDKEVAHA